MSDTIRKEYYKGFQIKVLQDNDPMSPRECDNLGTMACWHLRYNLGDVQPDESPTEWKQYLVDGEDSWSEERVDQEFLKKFISLPLYLYDHSGITISTTPFSCKWDSGQVGFIYVSKERVYEEFSCKRISPRVREKVLNCLRGEVNTYNDYLMGNVAGYTITGDRGEGEHIDSCWGFYPENGGFDYLVDEAKAVVDRHLKAQEGKND